MRAYLRTIVLLLIVLLDIAILKANNGEQVFKQSCAACHTIGGGRLVGPDLANISDRRSKGWLVSFIRSSSTMIRNGDNDAVDIFNEYNKLLMPDNDLSDGQIESIIEYIDHGGSSDMSGQVAIQEDILLGTTAENISNGMKLFSGHKRLSNKGAACNSCHKVRDERIFSSGILAKDLSESFEIMGSAGIAAILRNPPFPIMISSYKGHSLIEEEVIDITAYLRSVSNERYYQRPSDFSISFAFLGILVFAGVLIITIILYIKKKKLAVNQHILDRSSKVIN